MFSFFFSSRRRHTRFDCDWSSDVCSSDLKICNDQKFYDRRGKLQTGTRNCSTLPCTDDGQIGCLTTVAFKAADTTAFSPSDRSEERRVGKECRCWWVRSQ